MKNKLNRTVSVTGLFLPLFLLFLTSCSSLLTAKFEADTIGSLPDKTLPGNPTGDALQYASEIEPQLEVVATPTAADQKSLEYTSVAITGDISGHGSWLGFRGKSSNFANPVTFTWTAQRNFSPAGPELYIDCSDGQGVVAVRIRIMPNGDVILVDDIVTGTGNNVGNIPNNQRHSFLVTVDLPNEVYNISILKPSGNIVENGNPLLTSNVAVFHNPAQPSVSFKYGTFTASQEYVIDELSISRKN